jgi:hypothetical protein
MGQGEEQNIELQQMNLLVLGWHMASICRQAKFGSAVEYRYIERLLKDSHQIKQKPIGRKRFDTKCEKNAFINWVVSLECEINSIPPRNIYNFDGTSFQCGECKTETANIRHVCMQHASYACAYT